MAVAIAVLVFANGATAAIPMRALGWPPALEIAVPSTADVHSTRPPDGPTWHTFELVTVEDKTRATYRERGATSTPDARPHQP